MANNAVSSSQILNRPLHLVASLVQTPCVGANGLYGSRAALVTPAHSEKMYRDFNDRGQQRLARSAIIVAKPTAKKEDIWTVGAL